MQLIVTLAYKVVVRLLEFSRLLANARETYISRSLDTVSQQLNAVGSLIPGGALVELAEVDGVLESAVFDERAIGNLGVVFGQAHDEAEMDLGVGIELAGAEFDNIADALGGAVFAFDAAVSGGPGRRMLDMKGYTS